MSPRSNLLHGPLRRAFVGALILLGPLATGAAPRPAPKFLESRPDQAEGARILSAFREVGIAGDYWLRFDLRVMPRKGLERTLRGVIIGQRGTEGPRTRIDLDTPTPAANDAGPRFLLHGGDPGRAWRWESGLVVPYPLGADDWLAPIAGTDLTVFDLQMPFLRWPDYVFEGVANVRGRPAHTFLFYPPAEFGASSSARPAPAAIRAYLDAQFGAPVQAEWIAGEGRVLKSVTVLDLKKVDGQWLVRSIDLRNGVTRDKTRFQVAAVALHLAWPDSLFAPESLAAALPATPNGRVRRL